MSKRPTVLMILDGYGLNERHDGNAVFEAKIYCSSILRKDIKLLNSFQIVENIA